MTHKDPKLVYVRWDDSEADIGWDDYDDAKIKDRLLVTSIGWLLAENDHQILLVADMDVKNGHSNRVLRIPRICIEEMRHVKIGTVIEKPVEQVEEKVADTEAKG